MAPQATRIGIVFVSLILLFLGFRSVMVPESFGKEGHYRYDAVAQIAGRQVKYAGKKPCIECHADVNTPHTNAGVSCETCHGPGAAHVADFDSAKMEVPSTRAMCGTCHATNQARRVSFPQIDLTDHNPSRRCIDCHKVHPTDEQMKASGGKTPTVDPPPLAAVTPGSASAPSAAPSAEETKAAEPKGEEESNEQGGHE